MASKEFMAKVRAWADSYLDGARGAVQAALVNRWLELSGGLRSTLAAYQSAMDVRLAPPDTLVLALRDTPAMAQLVEFGQPPYDLRQTLLQPTTRAVRFGKKGLYLFVPLRKTTRQIREYGGSVAERAARALKPYSGGWGRPGESLPSGMAPKLRSYHATDPLDSLVRLPSEAPGGTSSYMTWRTISQAGRPWYHPGIDARNFMQRVAAEAPEIARRVLKG